MRALLAAAPLLAAACSWQLAVSGTANTNTRAAADEAACVAAVSAYREALAEACGAGTLPPAICVEQRRLLERVHDDAEAAATLDANVTRYVPAPLAPRLHALLDLIRRHRR